MDKTCFVLSPHAAPEPEPTYAGRAFVKMSPGRVVDYPLGLRSQGPEFKSPSGRFCRRNVDERRVFSVARQPSHRRATVASPHSTTSGSYCSTRRVHLRSSRPSSVVLLW